MRASGSTPCSFSAFSETTITAEAPSQIWLEVAAVIRPPSRSSFTPLIALERGVEADALVDRVQALDALGVLDLDRR